MSSVFWSMHTKHWAANSGHWAVTSGHRAVTSGHWAVTSQDFRKECLQRSEKRDRRIHSVIFEKTDLFHCVLWVFAEYTRIFAEYTRFLRVLRRIHSNAKGVYSAAEYTRISPDTLESRRIHSVSPNTLARRIHSNPKKYKNI